MSDARPPERLLQNRATRASLILLVLLALLVIAVPLISPYDYDGQDLELIGSPRLRIAHIGLAPTSSVRTR